MKFEQATRFLEEDASRLETRYQPLSEEKLTSYLGEFGADDSKIQAILDRCKEFKGSETISATLQKNRSGRLVLRLSKSVELSDRHRWIHPPLSAP